MDAEPIQILIASPHEFVSASIEAALHADAEKFGYHLNVVTSRAWEAGGGDRAHWDLVIATDGLIPALVAQGGSSIQTPFVRLQSSSASAESGLNHCEFDAWSPTDLKSAAFASHAHRALMMAHCIHLRRVAESESARSAEQFQFALDTAKMKTWSADFTDALFAHSSHAEQSRAVIQSRLSRVLSSDMGALMAAVAKAIKDREPFSAEFRVARDDGTTGWAFAKGRVITGPNEEPLAIAGIELDITERKLLEQQLRRAQRMETIGQLAGGVAHDFNNLITAIFGHVAMAADQLPAEHPVQRSLHAIEHVAQQGNRVTRGMLAFSKHSVGDKRLVDLCRIVDEAIRLVRPIMPASIRITMHIPREEPVWILADDAQLQQVILNVAVNARDAMPEGGELEVTVIARADQTVPGTAAAAVLRISDTGVGIAPDVQERIFDPFFTTKDRTYGTGLGLSIVHGIVSEHGGRIQVQSAPHRGTTFEISLPRAAAPLTAPRSPATPSHASRGRGELILVAEDHEQIRELIGATLRSLGYRVSLSANGEEFLDALRSQREQVRLALVDADLPKCTGSECVRQLRGHDDRLPVIVATGAVDLPVDDLVDEVTIILRKPYRMQTLAEHVAALMKQQHNGGESI
ncbi:MAG: response regulator [Phycisphaerales bacterium]|nr:response regulator [Phycisphaerales bacterium]